MRKLVSSNGGFIFLNPTNKPLVLKYDGREYPVDPFEEFEVQSRFMARHFEKKYKERGLVNITFTEGQQKIHKNYDAFYKVKCLEGLKALRDFAQLTLAREQQAVNEAALKSGSTVDSLFFKVGTFKEQLKEIEETIAKMMKPESPKEEKAAPASKPVDEPRGNKNSR